MDGVPEDLGGVEEEVKPGQPAPLPCDECARRFSTKKAMYRHKSEAHPKDKTKLMCPVCLVKVPALPPAKQFSNRQCIILECVFSSKAREKSP